MALTATHISFAPLVPESVLIGAAALAVLIIAYAAWKGLAGWIWRAVLVALIGLVLANPSLVEEEREPLSDIAVLVRDTSASMELGERREAADAFAGELRALAEADPMLDLVEIDAGESEDGTRLFDGVQSGLASVPRDRLAGVILATDGQVHDLPETAEGLLDSEAPLHAVIAGNMASTDRRLVIEEAPRYGIVGQTASFQLRVEDPAMQGSALVSFRFEGGEPQSHRLTIGRTTRIEVPVERRGANVIEIEVNEGPQEISLINNRAAVSVNGVRDRLRVLLVTGEPHNGARVWRDLLKSDPSVDLVHFTILRPPDRRDATPPEELALIGFPVRELFAERLDEFDLIIFDRYPRRNIIQMLYFDYIARYVENGGALLVTAGPPFAGPPSLYRTPLSAVLPVRPTGYITEEGFRPATTDLGERHPVTAGLAPPDGEPDWGRWFRVIHGTPLDGEILLETEEGLPLLVVSRQERGRTAMVMSDQTWLWSRGFDGGGPYAEMFRRVAHWLMQEPELDEERLTALAVDGELRAERITLADEAPPLELTWPDGRRETVDMQAGDTGRFTANIPATGSGLVRLRSGELTTVAALGPLNPREFADLQPTDDGLRPLTRETGGTTVSLGEGPDLRLPTVRRTRADSNQAGRAWLGLMRNERYVVRDARQTPLLPGLLVVLLAAGFLGLGWWREGR